MLLNSEVFLFYQEVHFSSRSRCETELGAQAVFSTPNITGIQVVATLVPVHFYSVPLMCIIINLNISFLTW